MSTNNGNKLTEVYSNLCRSLAESGDVVLLSDRFSRLNSNSERVAFVYELLKKKDLFPPLAGQQECDQLSVTFRQQGNEFFKSKKHEKALKSYTESIRNAVNKSESLGLAYANRSAVLFEKGLYRECLMDIEYAFESNYPKRLYDKLLQRKEKAYELAESQVYFDAHEKLPTLTVRNTYIECCADNVEIKQEEHLGRHIVAKNDIEVGVIAGIEKPYASVLLLYNYLTHCYTCLKYTYNLIPCENCNVALFCNIDCRNKCTSYHIYECPVLSTLMQLELHKLAFLALRVTLCAANDYKNIRNFIPSVSQSYKSQRYEEIQNLVANTEYRSVSDLFERATTAAVIYELIKKYTTFFLVNDETENVFKDVLLHHLQTGPSNFHEISELVVAGPGNFEMSEIGAGAYSFLSLLNHACCPNVVRHCYGTSIVLRAIAPIKKGDQLFDNYGYHYAVMPKSERQRYLKQQYYFTCTCQACTENWPLYQDMVEKDLDIGITEDDLANLKNADLKTAKNVIKHMQKNAKRLDSLKPCKNVADVQEIIKQCYAIFSNKRHLL